jgi:hypothetical protein
MTLYDISAFLSASCLHRCLAVARFAYGSDAEIFLNKY